jgi:amino acid transporter
MMGKSPEKFSFNATWAMAVGGMVGGGIFSVLGVVIAAAGQWAWLSFVLAGGIALVSAYSYSQLSIRFEKGGGAFTFLNEMRLEGMAASVAWMLTLGYVLTMSVYAFTFGHYVAHVIGSGIWLPRVLALAVIAALTYVNLRGVGEASRVEIITVWGKVFVLVALAAFGLNRWAPEQLLAGIEAEPWTAAIGAAATIFMAYEGFQLLSYDYEDIDTPRKTLPRATLLAVISVVIIYIIVALGATMLVGAETLVQEAEVALSIAGQRAWGTAGVVIVTIAAAFSTGSAINATLFSTSRLVESVAKQADLPAEFSRENSAHIPYYAVLTLAGLAAILATIGSLGALVNAASLIFLITFGAVNFIAFDEAIRYKYLSLLGALGCAAAIVFSVVEQWQNRPGSLLVVLGMIAAVFLLRPYLLAWMRRQGQR